MKLSILIPGVPTRFAQGSKLYRSLFDQAQKLPNPKDVEILWFVDNWYRSVGEKRNALLQSAKARYVAFIDDDDLVPDFYLERILAATRNDPDVITFRHDVTWNSRRELIEFRLDESNEGIPEGYIRKIPWHICVWKRDKIQHIRFPDVNWGEDAPWATEAKRWVSTETHIPEILHIYNHQDEKSEAGLRQAGLR